MNEVNIGSVIVFDHPEATKEQALKILEESAETVEAFKEWEKSRYELEANLLMEEVADVIQACANLIAALGLDDFTNYMEDCKQRNIERGRITVEEPEPDSWEKITSDSDLNAFEYCRVILKKDTSMIAPGVASALRRNSLILRMKELAGEE